MRVPHKKGLYSLGFRVEGLGFRVGAFQTFGVIQGLYRNNGKENGKDNGNYYLGFRVWGFPR